MNTSLVKKSKFLERKSDDLATEMAKDSLFHVTESLAEVEACFPPRLSAYDRVLRTYDWIQN